MKPGPRLVPAAGALDESSESLSARDVDGRLIRVDEITAAALDEDVHILIDGRPVTVKKAVPATGALGNYLKDAKGSIIPGRRRSTTPRRSSTPARSPATRSRSSATATT